MLKAVAVASGNDAAVALAEFIGGSHENFVAKMNERAKQLGMNDTTFINCNGLDDPNHLTSANDIALMSCELIKHPKVFDYTTIWMDSLRGGQFWLSEHQQNDSVLLRRNGRQNRLNQRCRLLRQRFSQAGRYEPDCGYYGRAVLQRAVC